MPRDRFGREIDYLRLSVTERCNLRCSYCMPERTCGKDALSPEDLGLIARAATSVGFRRFRLTGGEPLVRADIAEVVRAVASAPGVTDVSLTTNGVLLEKLARALREAGLRRVNVHLDALSDELLGRTMGGADLAKVLRGLEAAERAGLAPLKLNVVVVRGENDSGVAELARLTVERPWHVRFIELMPLGAGAGVSVARERFVPSDEVRGRVEDVLGPLERVAGDRLDDECRTYRLPGAAGVVGFISPVSAPFCDTCNRMRLTADGKLRLCLLSDTEIDLRPALARGEQAVRSLLVDAVLEKPMGHRLREGVVPATRAMHALGG